MAEPRILIWDLEIIPDLNQALKHWIKLCPPWGGSQTLKADVSSICTFGYKWFGEGRPKTINAWDYPNWNKNINDDKALCREIRKILMGADYWVYQNGDWFDKRHILTRLQLNGLAPLPDTPSADTKKIAKKNYLLISNSLEHQAEQFTDERKLKHGEGWDLWVDTCNKKKRAMDLMAKYCRHDVKATEALFKIQRPYIKNIPNHNLWNIGDGKVCPSCGSTRIKSNGYRSTKTSAYKRYNCIDCGSWSRTEITDRLPRSL